MNVHEILSHPLFYRLMFKTETCYLSIVTVYSQSVYLMLVVNVLICRHGRAA